MQAPSRQDVINFLSNACLKVSATCVRNSFRKFLGTVYEVLFAEVEDELKKNEEEPGCATDEDLEFLDDYIKVFNGPLLEAMFPGIEYNSLPESFEI